MRVLILLFTEKLVFLLSSKTLSYKARKKKLHFLIWVYQTLFFLTNAKAKIIGSKNNRKEFNGHCIVLKVGTDASLRQTSRTAQKILSKRYMV
ncbi:hypothetical protein BY996DRAFT_8396500, partial [Phakopsora pachyrhizi]